VYLKSKQKQAIDEWILENAERYWLTEGGPLAPPAKGGADVIIVDDPQMPGIIPLVKKTTPDRPVVYRSHIELRSDLISKEGTSQSDVWQYLWRNIKLSNLFISHPVPRFVPDNVPKSMVAYLPATTDW
jgi:alpha,alpha-trehalose phosphorylase (configuration-retaining)